MEMLKIKDLEIPTEIKNYKTSKSIKIYFKGNVLNITKPTQLSIYNQYKKILDSEVESIKQWQTGEKIYYQGEEFSVIRRFTNTARVTVSFKIDEKVFIIEVPVNLEQNIIKETVDKTMKKLLKNNTEVLISQKLPYWSEITG